MPLFSHILFPVPLSCLENTLLFHFVTIVFSPPYIKSLRRLGEKGEEEGNRVRGRGRGKAWWGAQPSPDPRLLLLFHALCHPHGDPLSLLYFMLSSVCLLNVSLSLFVYLSVCVSCYVFLHCLSASLSLPRSRSILSCQCVCVCLSICLSIYLPVYLRTQIFLSSPSHFLLFSHCLVDQKRVAGNSRLQSLFSIIVLRTVWGMETN